MQLHQFEVSSHNIFCHVVTCFGIGFVNIHTFQFYRLTIHQEQSVNSVTCFYRLNFKSAETHTIWYHFRNLTVAVLYSHKQFIQIRMLRSPCLNIRNLSFKCNSILAVVLNTNFLCSCSYSITRIIDQFICNISITYFSCEVMYSSFQLEDTILVAVIKSRSHSEIMKCKFGL